MKIESIARAFMVTALAVVGLGGVCASAGCSSPKRDRLVLNGGNTMDRKDALALLEAAEKSGKLEGLEIEHYVAGGLPPPYYRSEQFRLHVHEGRDSIGFVTPDFKAPGQGTSYPNHSYHLPATPAEVKQIARLARESGAFDKDPPADEAAGVRDRLRTELVVILRGKRATRVYISAEPSELAKLRAVIEPMIARLKAQGKHEVGP